MEKNGFIFMKPSNVALHGFFGLPTDWDFLESEFQKIDLYSYDYKDLRQFAKEFNQSFKNQQSTVIGYSLGGRLALHALIDNPSLWKSAIIVSAHPGLSNDHEKEMRLKDDIKWSERILSDDWFSLMNDWNSRSIFGKNRDLLLRNEQDYDRQKLADLLVRTSLGIQDDLKEAISELPMPIYWVVGQQDQKYVQVIQPLKFKNPLSKVIIVPNAAHRVPWEQPDIFGKIVEELAKRTKRT